MQTFQRAGRSGFNKFRRHQNPSVGGQDVKRSSPDQRNRKGKSSAQEASLSVADALLEDGRIDEAMKLASFDLDQV